MFGSWHSLKYLPLRSTTEKKSGILRNQASVQSIYFPLFDEKVSNWRRSGATHNYTPFPLETLKAHICLQYSIYGLLSHLALKSKGNKDLAEPDTSGSPAGYETQRYKNDKNIKQKKRANYRDFSWPVSRRAACLVFCALVLSLTSSSS